MTRLYKYFFRGLITVLPLALTIYLLYIFLAWTEAVALTFLRPFIGGFYVPGMGLALGILGILAIGYLVSKQRVQRFLTVVEMLLTTGRLVKGISTTVRKRCTRSLDTRYPMARMPRMPSARPMPGT